MKKIIAVAAGLALAGTQLQTARAGDREWATAGKILTGVAVGAVIVSAVNAQADCALNYYRGPGCVFPPPPPVVGAPRVVCAPAPVICATRPVVVYAPPPVVVYRPPVVAVRYGPGHRHGRGHGHHGRW